MAKRKPARLADRKVYIRRDSEIEGDKTLFFCDTDGRVVYFDKTVWAQTLMTTFKPEQKAQIVLRAPGPDDLPFQDWLRGILPQTVTVEEYLAAIEQNARDRRAGRQPSRRSVLQFMRDVGWR